ncbi:MAG: MBL fold metallo-hydrolase [Acidobacteria bacterium]|nr:MBL fold metallo-hydrolase [Acidobacteriota bacterium]
MKGRGWTAVLLLLFAVAAANAQGPDFSKIEIKAEKVAGNVYMLYGVGGFAGGNIGVSVGPDGTALVDAQFEPLVAKIEAALRGIAPKPVRFVINTHYHGDHTHGNKAFGRSATILAHENVRKRMAEDTSFDNAPNTPAPQHALPVITFSERATVHLNGEDLRGIHTPHAHTDGDTVVYFTQSNVVHMGDNFFNGMFPFIDLDGGGSVKGYIAATEQVLREAKPDVKIIPGHGPLATPDDLKNYLAMLQDTLAIVERGVKAGKTLEQLKQEKVLAKYDAWTWQFITTDRFLETLYKDLTRKPMGYQPHGHLNEKAGGR